MEAGTSGAPAGDAQAWFEEIVTRNYRLLFAVAYRVLRDGRDAEDAVQESVLKALRSLGKLEKREVVVGWLARIVRHTALDARRRPRAASESVEAAADKVALRSGAGGTVYADERAVLLDELGRLPEGQALVVTLRYLEGLEIGEVATRLGITANTARVRLHRGLQALKGCERLRRAAGRET